jgi:hypothetical protein
MKAPIQRSSLHRLRAGRPRFVAAPSNSHPLFFQIPNGCFEPRHNLLFDLALLVIAIQRVQRLTRCIERNVPARDFRRAKLRWYQINKNTITARNTIFFGIVVHARRRVLENKLRPPRRPWRTFIPSIFEEYEFKF